MQGGPFAVPAVRAFQRDRFVQPVQQPHHKIAGVAAGRVGRRAHHHRAVTGLVLLNVRLNLPAGIRHPGNVAGGVGRRLLHAGRIGRAIADLFDRQAVVVAHQILRQAHLPVRHQNHPRKPQRHDAEADLKQHIVPHGGHHLSDFAPLHHRAVVPFADQHGKVKGWNFLHQHGQK